MFGKGRGRLGTDLLELVLLGCFVFACFGGLTVQLLCCELGCEGRERMVSGLGFSRGLFRSGRTLHTFRLNRLFSRPLMMWVGSEVVVQNGFGRYVGIGCARLTM